MAPPSVFGMRRLPCTNWGGSHWNELRPSTSTITTRNGRLRTWPGGFCSPLNHALSVWNGSMPNSVDEGLLKSSIVSVLLSDQPCGLKIDHLVGVLELPQLKCLGHNSEWFQSELHCQNFYLHRVRYVDRSAGVIRLIFQPSGRNLRRARRSS